MGCIHDQGAEFNGFPFQNLLKTYNISSVPISVRNPQANSIIERMHQTMATQLRTILHAKETPQNFNQALNLVDTAIASTAFAYYDFYGSHYQQLSHWTSNEDSF